MVDAIDAGMIALAPVQLVIRMVKYPAVEDAELPSIAHPLPTTEEDANCVITIVSEEVTPATAQSIGTVEEAATVNDGAISEHVPVNIFEILVGATPKVAVLPTEIPWVNPVPLLIPPATGAVLGLRTGR